MSYVLPVDSYKNEVLNSIRNNSVTIICAETGAGKSTRVPEWLAEEFSYVVVTQPRIVAAETLAGYVAQNMNSELGDLVGYASSEMSLESENTRVMFVTDGLMLGRLLRSGRKNDMILVIDEVHEWNMNIENLVALAKVHKIKVVLMSATMEADTLAVYFGGAAIINIPGRNFDVEVIERPKDVLYDEVLSLARQGENVLVFLPGKSQIAKMHENLTVDLSHTNVTVFQLHSQLNQEERYLVFTELNQNESRVILATNIAQTSLTIPYITCVVDSGLENRLEMRGGVESLIEADISRSDCLQRKGRAGRVRAGKYILCSDSKMKDRQAFAIPEIQRCALDTTYLRLLSSGIRMEEMDYFHAPKYVELESAKLSLRKFKLIQDDEITPFGRKIARMPLSVRAGIMMLTAAEKGVLSEITTIVACMEAGDLRIKNNPWRLLTKERESDLIVQMDLFNFAMTYRSPGGVSFAEALRAKGIHAGNFRKARANRENVVDACISFLRQQKVHLTEEEKKLRIKECIFAGFRDSIYQGSYGSYSGPAGYRNLDRESVIMNSEYVVAEPFDLNGKNARGGTFELRLLVKATAIPSNWVTEVS